VKIEEASHYGRRHAEDDEMPIHISDGLPILLKECFRQVYSKAAGCKSIEIAYNCELAWFQFIYCKEIIVRHKVETHNAATPSLS